MGKYRSCGLERPLSAAQVVAVVAYLVGTGLFYGVVSWGSRQSATWRVAIGAISFVVVVVIAAFLFVSSVDPAVDPSPWERRCILPLYCFDPQTTTSRYVRDRTYCGLCRKMVPGMDHHCPWLNTCIGSRTYPAFYVIALGTTVQFAAQTACGAVLIADLSALSEVSARTVLLWGHNALALVLLGLLGSLLAFHTMLIRKNIGTFDLILQYREAQRNLMKRRVVKVAPLDSI